MKKFALLGICICLWGAGCGSSKSAEEIRKATEMVLLKGGAVTLAGTTVAVKSAAKLPTGKLNVVNVELIDKPFTDADLAQLQPLNRLEVLNLQGTQVTDAGMAQLKEFWNLNDLNLYHTAVTDKGLEQLQGLRRLKKLELSYTGLTDAGLDQLAQFRVLQSLYVRGTGVTDAGIAKFKEARPSCKIAK